MSDLNAIEYKRFEDIKRIREENIGAQENWDLHWIMHSGVISQRLLIER